MNRLRQQQLHPRAAEARSSQPHRSGTATVELAVILPILVLLVFGSIEASNAIFLKQASMVAAYETARIATAIGGTQAEAELRGSQILAARNINGATVSISPAINAGTPAGAEITVTVTVPSNANSIGPQFYYRNATLTSVFRMNRL